MTLPFPYPLLFAGFFCATALLAEADPATNPAPANTAVPAAKTPAAAPVSAAKAAPAAKPAPAPRPKPTLYRDTTEYSPLNLTWYVSTSQNQVTGVFPHPVIIQRAVLATEKGILLTEDAGHTWAPLPEATVDKVGPINDLAFDPALPDTFYLASDTKGVWVTSDAGKTFSQIGTKAKGMASDRVVSLIVYPGDSSHHTLLAVHGKTPGLSQSRDVGGTWDVVNADYCFRRVLGGEANLPEFYMIGSKEQEPDIQCVYCSSTVGELLREMARDVVPTDMAFAPLAYRKAGTVYLTTSDNGLYRIESNELNGNTHEITQPAFKDVDGWSSVGVTWGPSADIVNVYLYDPAKLGLIVTSDDLATYHTASNGLPTGSMVKEGAVIRPNANGTVFYNVANEALAIGRSPEEVPVVNFTPTAFEITANDDKNWHEMAEKFGELINAKTSTLEAAKALSEWAGGDLLKLHRATQLTITARVPLKPSPPTSVTVDLSRFGAGPATPLFDDGQHNDGAANDGVYGTSFTFVPVWHPPNNEVPEWRSTWPGRVAMGVTATYPDGTNRGAVGIVNIITNIPDYTLWPWGVKSVANSVEGGVTIEPFQNPPAPAKPPPPPGQPKFDVAARLNVTKSPWKAHFNVDYGHNNFNSYAALSFYLRVEAGEAPKELYLQVRDGPQYSLPVTTDRVPLLKGRELNADYQRIVIPMSQLLASTPQFQTDHFAEIILSGGDTDAPVTLNIEGMQALVTCPPPPPPLNPSPPPAPAPAQ